MNVNNFEKYKENEKKKLLSYELLKFMPLF
jgi:hypothetical protein